MKSKLTLCALAMTIWGCNDTSGPSGPPDLTMRDVVGCWKYDNGCAVMCFDRSSGYYYLRKDDQENLSEYNGTFVIKGHATYLNYHIITSRGKNQIDSGSLPFQRIGDSLRFVNNDGTFDAGTFTLIAPESFSCAIPWKFFTKPAGWDTLVKPLP